uniref:Uncharacterized protein n=1 Tax=viral metagenome TaxID=1070528 RepID=A0A6C0B592_9ZZZZ
MYDSDIKTQIKIRKNKIKKLYQAIINTGYWKENESVELNYNNILSDLYSINNLINNTFEIFSDDTLSDDEQAEKLLNLRDNNNNNVVNNLENAKKIIESYKIPLMLFFNKIKTKRKKNKTEIVNLKIHHGGATTNKRAELDIDDILKNIERVTLEKSKKFNESIRNDPEKLAAAISEIPEGMIQNDDAAINRIETITDWIFHPLWKLENIPIWGSLIAAPVDLVDTILNNCILIVETVYPIISIALSFAGTAGMSAAVAAVPIIGPVLAGSAWEVIVQPFLDWLIPNFLKIIAFFINIWRRDLPQAYVNALDFIPFMENTMHVLAGYLIKINKYIDMVYPITTSIRTYTEFSSNLALTLITNPSAFTDVDKFYTDVIKPNKTKIPIIKDLPEKILNNDDMILSIFYETIHSLTKCVRSAVNSQNITSCIEDFKLENLKNKVTDKIRDIVPEK